jgi:hypothetical protein
LEKLGRPAVSIITAGFTGAADDRAKVLGLSDHPRTRSEVEEMAARAVEAVALALVKR